MRPDYFRGALSSDTTTTYQSIEDFVKKYKAKEEDVMLKMPPIPGQRIGTAERRESIPAGQVYSKESSTVAPSPQTRWLSLPSTTPGGGGQYIADPEQPGRLIKIDREGKIDDSKVYDLESDKILARRGLPAYYYQVDHIMPIWAGGADTMANKMILTNDRHEVKTKVGNVARQLYYDDLISLGEARTMLLNWEGKDVDNIPAATTGRIPSDVAYKKWKEWQTDPNAGVYKRALEAYKRWGIGEGIETYAEEARKNYFAGIESLRGPEVEGAAAIPGSFLAGTTRPWASLATGTGNLMQDAWNAITWGDWEIKKDRQLFGGPLESFAQKGIVPKDWKKMSELAGLTGEVASGFGQMIMAFSALGAAKNAIALKYGIPRALLPTAKFLGNTYTPFKSIPLLKNISFTTGNLLEGGAYFSLWSQFSPMEKKGIENRLKVAGKEFFMGALFSSVGKARETWKQLGSGSAVVGSGTYVISRLAGNDPKEAFNEAATMALFHFVLGADRKRTERSVLPVGIQDVTTLADRMSRETLSKYLRRLKIEGDFPPPGPDGKYQVAKVAETEIEMIDTINRKKRDGEIKPDDAAKMITDIKIAVEWAKIRNMDSGVERDRAMNEFLTQVTQIAKTPAKTTKDSLSASKEKLDEFYAANDDYVIDGKIEETDASDYAKVTEVPKTDIQLKGTARESIDAYENLNRLAETKMAEDNRVNVELVRDRENDNVAVWSEVDGRIVKVGDVPVESQQTISKEMDRLGLEVLPATVKMDNVEGKLFPDIKVGKTDTTANLEITNEHWADAVRGAERINEMAKEYQVGEDVKTPEMESIQNAIRERIIYDDSLGDYSFNNSLGYLIESMAGDPVKFNKTYSKNADSPIIDSTLVNKIINQTEQVRIGELLSAVNTAYKSGDIKRPSGTEGDILKLMDNISSQSGNIYRKNALALLAKTKLGELTNVPVTATPTAASIIKGKAKAAADIAATAKRQVTEISRSLAKGERMTGKKPSEMTVKEAIEAPKSVFNSWIGNKTPGKPINNYEDLGNAKDAYNALIGRNQIGNAKDLIDSLESSDAAPASLKEDVAKFKNNALSKIKAEEVRAAAKKKPETTEQKVKKAIKEKPVVFETEPKKAMEQENKKPVTKTQERREDVKQQQTADDIYDKSASELRAETIKEDEDIRIEMDEKLPVEGEKFTTPEDIKDPDTKRESIAYRDFYSYDGEGKLAYGNRFLKNKIAEYRQSDNKEMLKEAKADQKKFTQHNMKRRADHYNRKYKGNYKKGQEAFIKEFAEIFAKHGDTNVLDPKNSKSFANRQYLKKRYNHMIVQTEKKLFSIILKYSPKGEVIGEELHVNTDPSPRSSSFLYERSRKYEKENPGVNLETVYFDESASSDWLRPKGARRKGKADIIEALKRGYIDDNGKVVRYVFMGRPKNKLSSAWGVRFDKKLVNKFDADPEKYLPENLYNKYIRGGNVEGMSDDTKFTWVYARDILGLQDSIDTNTMIERAQLLDNKWPKNMANQGEKYNVIVYKALGDNITKKFNGKEYNVREGSLGDVVDKPFEEWIKNEKGNIDSLRQNYDRPVDDGSAYITRELAEELRNANGFVQRLYSIKPTEASFYKAKDGTEKALLQKMQFQVMDKNLESILEKKKGSKINKYDILTTDENIKFGLDNRMKQLKNGEIKTIEQPVNADSFRLRWEKPHETAGSFGVSALSKIPAGAEANKFISEMMKQPILDFVTFTNLLRAPAGGKYSIKVFNEFLDKFHIDIPKHMYEGVVDSIKADAGQYTHNRRFQRIMLKLFQKKLLGGGFLKRDNLKLVPDHGYNDGKYFQKGNSVLSLKTFKKLYGDDVEGKIGRSPDGYVTWADTGKPVRIATVRYPVNSVDNITISKVRIGEHYGIKNLGDNNMILPHEDVYVNKQGDYDGDTAAVFAVGDIGNRIPEGLADIIEKQPSIIPDMTAGAKRPKKELSSENISEMSSRVWVAEQAINNVHAATRPMESYVDSKIKIVAKGDGVNEDRVVDVYFGNSDTPFRPKGEPMFKLDHTKRPAPAPQPDLVATPKFGEEGRVLAKSLSGWSTDAAKNDSIYNWTESQGIKPEQQGFPKTIMFKNYFEQSGLDHLEDPSIIQALHNIDKYYQAIHRMAKADDPTDIMEALYEGRGLQIKEFDLADRPSSFMDLENSLGETFKLLDAIEAGGGNVHPVFETIRGMKEWGAIPDYAANKKLQYQADKKGRDMHNMFFNDLSINTPESYGYKGLDKSDIKILLLTTRRLGLTRDAYNKYKSKAEHNIGKYSKWNNEIGSEYELYDKGAKNVKGEVLSRAEWEKKTSSPDQEMPKVPGQTYEEYVNGATTPLSPDEWKNSAASSVRKKMYLELLDVIEQLSDAGKERLANYLIQNENGNLKSHPAWEANNEYKGETLMWRYDDFIPLLSPAQAEIYYGAKESYIDETIRKEALEVGKEIHEFTTEDAKAIMDKFNKMLPDKKKQYWEQAESFKESISSPPTEEETKESWGRDLNQRLKDAGVL